MTSDIFKFQQKSSFISQMLLDEIRSERRLAVSQLNSKVSVVASNELNDLSYKRRNAIIKKEANKKI